MAAAVLVAALVAFPATVLAQSEAARAKIGPSVDDFSLYGSFLAGQAALKHGHGAEGARRLIDAAVARPDDALLREHAFAAALIVGDIPAAARLAPAGASDAQGIGRLARAVDALASGRGGEADKALAGPRVALPNHAAILLMKPFAAAAAGDWARATAAHDDEGDQLVVLFDQSSRARLMELQGRTGEAEALYKTLAGDPITSTLFSLPYGEFLERHGRAREALPIYDKALIDAPNDNALIAARARAKSGGRPPAAPTIRQAAAETLTYAAEFMSNMRQPQLALIYARFALRLDPTLAAGWKMAGDSLAAGKDEAGAREAWAKVPPASPFYGDAVTRTAYSLQRSGEPQAALAAARELARRDPASIQAQLLLADLLRSGGEYAEASKTLDGLIDHGGGSDWQVWYMRASVREALGRWPDAQADLEAALKIEPNEPELLNYLGYQWVDRGQDVSDGLALIERAVKARPRSGAMQDSLGWAHYRMGDYPKAVEVLENAVTLEPSDPAINDHLGDAYWMVGRKDEAGFQWRRALSFTPDAPLKAQVEVKLKDGLGAKSQVAGK